MLEKPPIDDDTILSTLRRQYGLPVSTIKFLPIGNDFSAWVYRVDSDDETPYFLKLKRGSVDPAAGQVPHFLHNSGIPQIVAPLPTRQQQLWTETRGYTLILLPYIEGGSGMDLGLSDAQWIDYGAVLRQIHDSQPSDELLNYLECETFAPQWNASLFDRIEYGSFEDMTSRALAAFWRERSAEIRRIVARCESLGRSLQEQSPPLVLCHTDYHTANILLDAQGQIHVVDWDAPLLAPKERDLMFIVGSDQTNSREVALFFQGYGPADTDLVGIAYYRYEWVVQEFNDYATRILAMPDLGDESRRDALRHFRALFDPGDVVEAAYQSDEALSDDTGT